MGEIKHPFGIGSHFVYQSQSDTIHRNPTCAQTDHDTLARHGGANIEFDRVEMQRLADIGGGPDDLCQTCVTGKERERATAFLEATE
jgi:hypothetical protein